ncbi:hypothetical protein HDU89_001456 [Geranomyces variabilis]|nr:hypothetical protein HDU89_001456 [Geranomyces variabilis]
MIAVRLRELKNCEVKDEVAGREVVLVLEVVGVMIGEGLTDGVMLVDVAVAAVNDGEEVTGRVVMLVPEIVGCEFREGFGGGDETLLNAAAVAVKSDEDDGNAVEEAAGKELLLGGNMDNEIELGASLVGCADEIAIAVKISLEVATSVLVDEGDELAAAVLRRVVSVVADVDFLRADRRVFSGLDKVVRSFGDLRDERSLVIVAKRADVVVCVTIVVGGKTGVCTKEVLLPAIVVRGIDV